MQSSPACTVYALPVYNNNTLTGESDGKLIQGQKFKTWKYCPFVSVISMMIVKEPAFPLISMIIIILTITHLIEAILIFFILQLYIL